MRNPMGRLAPYSTFSKVTMGKPTVQQISGVDILDWIYFNQTLHSVMGSDVVAWFAEIVERVKTAVAATGAVGIEAEIMKHYVFCFLEILASYENPDMDVKNKELSRYCMDFFCATLIAISKRTRNDSLSEARGITITLVDYVLSAPMVVRWRLAERCLAAEYTFATHECFLWLVKVEAISCAKFTGADVSSHEAVVARIGLLVEFEWARFHFRNVQKETHLARYRFDDISDTLPMQATLITEARDLWVARFLDDVPSAVPNGFDVGRQSDKDYVVDFLNRVHPHWTRKCFCKCTLAGWVSHLGALSIMICKSRKDPRPGYDENHKERDTLAKEAKDTLEQRYGMRINTRTLWERHNAFMETMRPRIEVYCESIATISIWNVFDFRGAEEEDFFYKVLFEDFPWDTAKSEHWTVEHPGYVAWSEKQPHRVTHGVASPKLAALVAIQEQIQEIVNAKPFAMLRPL